MSSIMITIAAAAQPAGVGQAGSLGQMLMPMIIIFGIFYFMMIRPQMRKEKERKSMISEIKTGSKVLFGGGLIGTISNVKETTFIVKVADNVKVEIVRGAVSRVIEKGEKISEEAK